MLTRSLLLVVLLSACVSAAAPNRIVYPVETAREDGDWTLLYRDVPKDINKDGYVTFPIPSEWTPLGLQDMNYLIAKIDRDEDSAVITLTRFKP